MVQSLVLKRVLNDIKRNTEAKVNKEKIMDIIIIGWVWLGIVVGILIGIMITSIMANRKQTELESENLHLIFVRDYLSI